MLKKKKLINNKINDKKTMISRNRKKYNSQSPFSMSCMGPKPPMAENSGKLSGFPTIKPALSSLASATSVKKRLHDLHIWQGE